MLKERNILNYEKRLHKAFIETLQTGMSVDEALSGLRRALEEKSYQITASILSEALRILETEKGLSKRLYRFLQKKL